MGSGTFPFSSPESGAQNFNELLQSINLEDQDVIDVVYSETEGIEQYIIPTNSNHIIIREDITIRSWIGNQKKPTICLPNDCSLWFINNYGYPLIENILFRKPGGIGLCYDCYDCYEYDNTITPFIRASNTQIEITGCEFIFEDTHEIAALKIPVSAVHIENDRSFYFFPHIHHNIFHHVPCGIYFHGDGVSIHNNTMYSVMICGISAIQLSDPNYSVEIYNNIICRQNNDVFGMKLCITGYSTFDYNNIYPDRQKYSYWFVNESRVTSPGTHSTYYDPMFYNADFGDFRLRPESPCIHTGLNYTDKGAFGTTYYGNIDLYSKEGNGTKSFPFNTDQLKKLCSGDTLTVIIDCNTHYIRIVDNDIIRLNGQNTSGEFNAFEGIRVSLTIDRFEYGDPYKIRFGNETTLGLESWVVGKTLTIKDGIFHGFDIDGDSGLYYPGTSKIRILNCLIYGDVLMDYMKEILIQFSGCTFKDSEIFIHGSYDYDHYYPTCEIIHNGITYTQYGYYYPFDNKLYFSDCVFVNSFILDDDIKYTDHDGTQKLYFAYGDVYARHCIFTMSKEVIDYHLRDTTVKQNTADWNNTYKQDYTFENSTSSFDIPIKCRFPSFEEANKWLLNYWYYGLPDTSEERSIFWEDDYLDIARGLWDRVRKGPGAFFFAHGQEKFGLTFTFFRLNVGEITYSGIPFIFPGGRLKIKGGKYIPEPEPGEVFCVNDFNINEIPQITLKDAVPKPYPVFVPIQDNTNNKPVLYFGFKGEQLNGTDQSLFFSMENIPLFNRRKIDGYVSEAIAEIRWQYYGKNGWGDVLVSDRTKSFSRSQVIEFTFPEDAEKSILFGTEQYWIRGVLNNPEVTSLLQNKISGIFQNAVFTENRVTVKNEILGASIGTEGQIFKLQYTPVAKGQQIWVRELDIPTDDELDLLILESLNIQKSEINDVIRESFDGVRKTYTIDGTVQDVYVRWIEVPDFYNSTPMSRHYQLNRFSGEIVFGDGIKGKIPDAGHDNIIASSYAFGGGTKGNILKGEIREIRNNLPLIKDVMNIENGKGGGDAETIQKITLRGPSSVSSGIRAAGVTDFESAVQNTSTNIIQVKCFDTQAADLLYKEGAVTIAILTSEMSDRPVPSQHVIEALYDKLEMIMSPVLRDQSSNRNVTSSSGDKHSIREIISHVKIIPPNYVTIRIEAEVYFENISSAKEQAAAIEKSLSDFMHPAYGGPEGRGWVFGKPVHKAVIQKYIGSKEGVVSIEKVMLKANQIRLNAALNQNIPVPAHGDIPMQLMPGLQVVLFNPEYRVSHYYLLGETTLDGNTSLILEGFKEGDTVEVILLKNGDQREIAIGKTRLTSITMMLLKEENRLTGESDIFERKSVARIECERLMLDTIKVNENGSKEEISLNNEDNLFLRTIREKNGSDQNVREIRIQSNIIQLTERNGTRFGSSLTEPDDNIKSIKYLKVADIVSMIIDICPSSIDEIINGQIITSFENENIPFSIKPDGNITEYTDRVFLSQNDLPCSGAHAIIVKSNNGGAI